MIDTQSIRVPFKQLAKELFSLAFPMLVTQTITVLGSFLAILLLSKLGQDVLAASALMLPLRISILIVGSSFLFALSISISHSYGKKDYQRIGNFLRLGWLLGFIISIFIFIIYWHIQSILLYFGQLKNLTDIVQSFFHANIWNIFPFVLSVCNQQLLYGVQKQKIDLIANFFGVIVLLTASYLLIHGHGGFPKLGVQGISYAFALQGWTYLLLTTFIIASSRFFKPFHLFSFHFQSSYHDIIHLFKIGWPVCVQISGEMLSFSVGAVMIGWLGMTALAASQVVMQCLFLVMIPLFALSQASGILISQALGEKQFYKIKSIGRASFLFSFIITATAGSIFCIFPRQLAALYLAVHNTELAETLHFIRLLFIILSIHLIIDGIRNVLTGTLRGLFDTQFPMWIGLISIWGIGLPCSYFLAFNLSFGLTGMAIGPTLGVLFGALVLFYRWNQKITEMSSLKLNYLGIRLNTSTSTSSE